MTVAVWRIATEGKTYPADDLSGTGAMKSGGRWNSVGVPVVYAASNIALAVLETIVHFNTTGLPLNRYLVRIDIPDDIWEKRTIIAPGDLVGWDAIPAGRTSIKTGDEWVSSHAALLLQVPSIIVPEESNILVKPHHEATARLKVSMVRRWVYDQRLRDGR